MDRHTDTLEPPNDHPHFVLPGGHRQVSSRASGHGSIVAVYRNGIEFIDQLGAMHGFLTLIGVWGSVVPIWILLESNSGVPWDMVILLFVCFLMVRADNAKFRYYPVLFDRAAGKVHLFVDVKIPWWKIWQLLPPVRVESWDWAQARAEVVEAVIVSGSAARAEYALVCAITDKPCGDQVIARFGVGLTGSYDGGQTMVERWEHIRRFMGEGGPHLAPGDAMFRDDSTVKLLNAITWGQPLLGPGSREFWSGSFLHGWWFFTIPAGALMLVFLPFTVTSGLLRYVLHRVRRAPRWPQEILASVGQQMPLTRR